MFKGSLRFNLDPFGQYQDVDLWRALEAVELKERIEHLPYKLDAQVVSESWLYGSFCSNLYSQTEDGKNFSAGERQLISLCR